MTYVNFFKIEIYIYVLLIEIFNNIRLAKEQSAQ